MNSTDNNKIIPNPKSNISRKTSENVHDSTLSEFDKDRLFFGKGIEGNFVLLTLDKIKILVKQSDIGQAQYLPLDSRWLKYSPNEQSDQGFFVVETIEETRADSVFVFLSDTLKPLSTPIHDRFIALPFLSMPFLSVPCLSTSNANQPNQFSQSGPRLLWLWRGVQMLVNQEFEVIQLPQFIYQNHSPVVGYVVYNNEIVYYCQTEKLISYALASHLSTQHSSINHSLEKISL